MTTGSTQTVKVNAVNGKGDTIKFTSNKKSVVKVNKASAVANKNKVASTTVTALKAGTAKITATSKYTGKKKTFTIKVTADAVVPTPTTTGSAVVTTPSVSTTPTATTPGGNQGGNQGGNATDAPQTTTGAATTAPATSENPDVTTNPGVTGDPDATQDPNATKDPNETQKPDATQNPDVTTNPAITTEPATTATPSALEFSAKQTGEKKITITNPTAMTKADIVVKRGNSAVTIDTITFDENATTAVVTLAGSIVATNYTITVGDNTQTITGEASTVADIQITSDVVAMDGQIGTATQGFANYAVYNQFGENITAKTSLVANTSANSISLDPTNGTMTIDWSTSAPRLNDMVSVVLMYQNTGKSVTKMLTVATQAAPAEVEVKGVYNRDGKILSATNVDKEDFYYLFRVKDQYGNYMTSSTVDFTGATPNMYITTAIGMTNVDINTTTLQTINVDGVNYLGFPIEKKTAGTSIVAGDITVMLIPGGSGKTVTDKITIGKGNTVTSLTISVPGTLPSGSSMDLEYVALDENGDEVTDYRVLKEVTPSDTTNFKWIKEDGKVVLRYDDSSVNTTAGSTVSCVFQLPNYETRLVTINVTDPIHVAAISGIDSAVAKATRVSGTVTIPVDKLSLQDQYGNSIGTSSLVSAVASKSEGSLGVMVVEEDSNNTVFTPTTGDQIYTDKNNTSISNAYILGSTESFTFLGDATLLGTENVTFKLVKYDRINNTWIDYETTSYTGAKTNNTQVGSYTTTLTNTKDSKFVSYDVNTIDTLYNGSNSDNNYKKSVEVKGVLSNGEKVALVAGTDFKVVPGENVAAGTSDADIKAANNLFATGTDETKTGKYSVVINYTGETIEKKVTIAKATPTTATVAFADGYTKKGVNITASNLNASATSAVSYFMTSDGSTAYIIKAKDSYGVDATVDAVGKVTLVDSNSEQMIYTVSDIDTVAGTVTNNGTATPSFTDFAAGDSFKLTYTVGATTFSTIVSVQ